MTTDTCMYSQGIQSSWTPIKPIITQSSLAMITALDDTEVQNRTKSGHKFSGQTLQQLIILTRKVFTFYSFFLQTIESINEVFDFMILFCSSLQATLKKKSQSLSSPECSTEIWPALLLACHLPRPGTISSPCISWTADARCLQKLWPEDSSVRCLSQARTTFLLFP